MSKGKLLLGNNSVLNLLITTYSARMSINKGLYICNAYASLLILASGP